MAHAPILGSIHNPRVRAWRALREPRERRRSGLLLLDGAREIGRAMALGVVIEDLIVSPTSLTPEAREVVAVAAADRDVPRTEVSADLLGRLAFGDRDDGLLAVARIPDVTLEPFAARVPSEPLLLVLEAVEKPGNLGAALRTADGAGVDGVIVADPTSDPWNPGCIRASMGTIFRVPLAVTDAPTARRWLVDRGVRVVTAVVEAPTSYTGTDLTGSVALVIGSEAEGLTSVWRDDDTEPVRIPMLGIADSLNVSVSAAVLTYEARRQRDQRTREAAS